MRLLRRSRPTTTRCPGCGTPLPTGGDRVDCAACGLSATDAAYRRGEAVAWYCLVRAGEESTGNP